MAEEDGDGRRSDAADEPPRRVAEELRVEGPASRERREEREGRPELDDREGRRVVEELEMRGPPRREDAWRDGRRADRLIAADPDFVAAIRGVRESIDRNTEARRADDEEIRRLRGDVAGLRRERDIDRHPAARPEDINRLRDDMRAQMDELRREQQQRRETTPPPVPPPRNPAPEPQSAAQEDGMDKVIKVLAAIFLGLLILIGIGWGLRQLGVTWQGVGGSGSPAGSVNVGGATNSPFIAAAPPGHKFVGATRGRDGDSCDARGGQIVPDTSRPPIETEKGWARPNRCTAD